MELVFSYIAGQGSSITDVIDAMNQKRDFFISRDYSTSVDRLTLIFVTSLMTTNEKASFKIKLAKFDLRVVINIYLEENDLRSKTLFEKANYLQLLVSNSFRKHKRLQNLTFDYQKFLLDFQSFCDNV